MRVRAVAAAFAAVAAGARPEGAARRPLAPLSPAARDGSALETRNCSAGTGVGA